LDYEALGHLDAKVSACIRDSKTLSSKQRDRMLPVIASVSWEAHVGWPTNVRFERLGIQEACFWR